MKRGTGRRRRHAAQDHRDRQSCICKEWCAACRWPITSSIRAKDRRRDAREKRRRRWISARNGSTWGAGPRASLNLILAAKAHAIVHGQVYVSCDDVAAVAPSDPAPPPHPQFRRAERRRDQRRHRAADPGEDSEGSIRTVRITAARVAQCTQSRFWLRDLCEAVATANSAA